MSGGVSEDPHVVDCRAGLGDLIAFHYLQFTDQDD